MAAVNATQAALQPAAQPKGTLKIENTDKRDTLIASEKKYQKAWADSKVFEQDAPSLQDVPLSFGARAWSGTCLLYTSDAADE